MYNYVFQYFKYVFYLRIFFLIIMYFFIVNCYMVKIIKINKDIKKLEKGFLFFVLYCFKLDS